MTTDQSATTPAAEPDAVAAWTDGAASLPTPPGVARRAAELAAEGRDVFDAAFIPPPAPRTIGVHW